MEARPDLASILPYLPPLVQKDGSLCWPPAALASLKALSLGPDVSRVDSGEVLFDAILDLREALSLRNPIAPSAAEGYALFFDELMSRMDSKVWFSEILPSLVRIDLQLPSLLEAHYRNSDVIACQNATGLRILGPQDTGIVFLSQELIAALLGCAFFCLFPAIGRAEKHLPYINFDHLFAALLDCSMQSQEHKLKCLIHYFERICLNTPSGVVSYERKVLPLSNKDSGVLYPLADNWMRSHSSLCSFKVFSTGLIEDQEYEALEVDFANEYLGGGALSKGCVQEEIRFMINPELIVGMLFMSSMEHNEAIEICGAERFSQYMGYGFSFRFVGDYKDKKQFDSMGRRKTRILAIDALVCTKMSQYETKSLLREVNKAYCGFLSRSKYQLSLKLFQDFNESHKDSINTNEFSSSKLAERDEMSSVQTNFEDDAVGIATGNWGCGVFGGDPEVKSILQWLAASQAQRPFLHYYTFKDKSLDQLNEATEWIQRHGWSVGELWSMLIEYSGQRLRQETHGGFFSWLLPKAKGWLPK